MNDIIVKQQEIIRNIIGDDSIVLTRETTAKDIDGWDSLTHMQIISTIEKNFKIRFALGELAALKNVGDMTDLIIKKIN